MRHSALIYAKIVLAVLIISLLSTYAYLQSRRYLKGPIIEIVSPQNGATITENPVHIKGMAQNITFLSLNDREITTDTDGYFDETLLLAPDYSIMTLRARDRFDREVVKRLEVVFKEQSSTTPEAPTSTTTPLL